MQNPEKISYERVATALHTMQDHLQQTTVIAQQITEDALRTIHVKNEGQRILRGHGGLTQARETQDEARHH